MKRIHTGPTRRQRLATEMGHAAAQAAAADDARLGEAITMITAITAGQAFGAVLQAKLAEQALTIRQDKLAGFKNLTAAIDEVVNDVSIGAMSREEGVVDFLRDLLRESVGKLSWPLLATYFDTAVIEAQAASPTSRAVRIAGVERDHGLGGGPGN